MPNRFSSSYNRLSKWLSRHSSRFSRWVSSFSRRKVSLPPYRDKAECKDPEWGRNLARLPAYKDLLVWVALQRDSRINKIVGTKREEDLRELRGEIRAIEQMYKSLASYIEEK